jgi:hypothetical protein
MEQAESWSTQKNGASRCMRQAFACCKEEHGAEAWSRCMEQLHGADAWSRCMEQMHGASRSMVQAVAWRRHMEQADT